MIELILGGARSGKSVLAEKRAAESGLAVTYIATAQIGDAEMQQRIAHHRVRRPAHWGLVEEPIKLAAVLAGQARADKCLLVDCLTLWLSNLLFAGQAASQAEAGEPVTCPMFNGERAALLELLPRLPGRVILITNEVGMGVIPMGASTRLFVDESGRLSQAIAQIAQRVTLVAAGLSLEMKNAEQ